MTYLDHLLSCAKWYHHHEEEGKEIPTMFSEEDSVFESMKGALLGEAHASMIQPVEAPEKMVYNAMDLGSDEPGIGMDQDVSRGDSVIRPVKYTLVTSDFSKNPPTPPTFKQIDKEKFQNRIEKCILQSEARREKAVQTSQNRAKRALEPRKKEKEKEDHPVPDPEEERKEERKEEKEQKKEKKEKKKAEVDFDCVEEPEDSLSQRRSRRRKKAQGEATKYHETPAPFDRHLTGLTMGCRPSEAMRGTLLSGSPPSCEGLVLIQGPPGTGKTGRLLEELSRLVDRGERCLVCAPSNLNVCDLYMRCLQAGIPSFLCLAKEHMPPHVPRRKLVDLDNAQVVLSTLCGRFSPKLIHQSFTSVLLDEAAKCSEPFTWGLIRPEVRNLVLCGDIHQLPQRVSKEGESLKRSRSLLERLIQIGVDHTCLVRQRRMASSILDYPNRTFYGGSMLGREDEDGEEEDGSFRILIMREGEEKRVGTSYENVEEAKEAVRHGCTTILVPYQAQARRIHSLCSGLCVETVDSSQGKEYEHVLLCTVRTDGIQDGFWSEKARMVVALTRARSSLTVLLHESWVGTDTELGRLADDAIRRGLSSTRREGS